MFLISSTSSSFVIKSWTYVRPVIRGSVGVVLMDKMVGYMMVLWGRKEIGESVERIIRKKQKGFLLYFIQWFYCYCCINQIVRFYEFASILLFSYDFDGCIKKYCFQLGQFIQTLLTYTIDNQALLLVIIKQKQQSSTNQQPPFIQQPFQISTSNHHHLPMDELPLSLISNDLKYALSSMKIKTFQRARQYYYTQKQAIESGQMQIEQLGGVGDKLEKIKKYLGKYNAVREDVLDKINGWARREAAGGGGGYRDGEGRHRDEDGDGEGEGEVIDLEFDIDQRPQLLPPQDPDSDQDEDIEINEFDKQPQQQALQQPQQQTEAITSKQLNLIKSEREEILQTQQMKQPKQASFNDSRQSAYSIISFDFDLKKNHQVFKEEWANIQKPLTKLQPSWQIMEVEELVEQAASKKVKYNDLFEKSILDTGIVEICGSKGIGKTPLLLYCCQRFAEASNRKLYFINCGGGITVKRFQRLQRNCSNLQYRDSYQLQHVLSVCRSAQSDPSTGFIAIDSLTNLLMQQQKTLIFLIKLFKIFCQLLAKGCKVMLTNYIQQYYEQEEGVQLTNHYSYYSSVTSEFLSYKFMLDRIPKSEKKVVRMIRGGFVEVEFDVSEDGVGSLSVKKKEEENKMA